MKLHICRYCATFALGKIHVQVGGLLYKRGPFWLWDGVHVAWGDHVVRAWWNSHNGARFERAYEPLPVIPDPPGNRPARKAA